MKHELPLLLRQDAKRLSEALDRLASHRPELFLGGAPGQAQAESNFNVLDNNFLDDRVCPQCVLAVMFASLGPERARGLVDALREGPYGYVAEEVAKFAEEVRSVALSPPPDVKKDLEKAAHILILRMDSHLSYEDMMASLKGVLASLAKRLDVDRKTAMVVAVAATAAAATPHVEVVRTPSGDLYRVAVDVYGRRLWLADPMTAVDMAANHFWNFGPVAEELLDRFADGVRRAVAASPWAEAVSDVRRGLLVREVTVRTSLYRFLGVRAPPLPDVDLSVVIKVDAKLMAEVPAIASVLVHGLEGVGKKIDAWWHPVSPERSKNVSHVVQGVVRDLLKALGTSVRDEVIIDAAPVIYAMTLQARGYGERKSFRQGFVKRLEGATVTIRDGFLAPARVSYQGSSTYYDPHLGAHFLSFEPNVLISTGRRRPLSSDKVEELARQVGLNVRFVDVYDDTVSFDVDGGLIPLAPADLYGGISRLLSAVERLATILAGAVTVEKGVARPTIGAPTDEESVPA